MSKRAPLSVGKFLVILNLAWYVLFCLLLAGNAWQYRVRKEQERTIATIKNELRWKSYVTEKAQVKAARVPELEFLARTILTRDPGLYAISRAAWKYGPRLERWPQVRNGAALIMAVCHRETLFGRYSRSYRVKKDAGGQPVLDQAGIPVKIAVAYGPMQLNYAVWKDELSLDLKRIDNPDYSVAMAVEILLRYLKKNNGDLSATLFDYWGGALAGGSYTYPPRVLESEHFDSHPSAAIAAIGAMR